VFLQSSWVTCSFYSHLQRHRRLTVEILIANSYSQGDNVISSRDTTWRLYREIITPGLQSNFDTALMVANAEELCSSILVMQHTNEDRGVPVQDLLQQFTIANVSQVLLHANHVCRSVKKSRGVLYTNLRCIEILESKRTISSSAATSGEERDFQASFHELSGPR
jgi:hypothetical protein